MKIEGESKNWCLECGKSCCDHFALEDWSKNKVEGLLDKYPFFKIDDHFWGEDEFGKVFEMWIMNCERFLEDGSCLDYPNNRPGFCERAGVRYKPSENCKLFDEVVKKNPDRCD